MNRPTSASRIASALLLTFAAAVSLPSSAQPATTSHGGKDTPASAHGGMGMQDMMKQMNEEMAAMPMSGDQDVDFAKMMRIHHVGAIDMAKAELASGRNPQLRKLAQDIIMAQNREIAIIDKYLSVHGRPVTKK